MKISKKYVCLLLSLIVLGVYYPLIFSPFNSVDDLALSKYLLNLGHFDLAKHFFPGGEHNYYRPVLMLSYVADQCLWGGDPSFMHLENVLLHLSNVLLVFFISLQLCRILSIQNVTLPFFSSVIFAIHPINVESVAWVVGRTDLLAGFFVLLALLFLLFALRFGSFQYGLYGAFFLLVGCLSKETALFFIPGVFLLLFLPKSSSLWFSRTDLTFRLSLLGCYGFSAVVYFIMRFIAVNSDRGVRYVLSFAEQNSAQSVSDVISTLVSVSTLFLKTSGFYLTKLVMPFPLNFGIVEVGNGYVLPGFILMILVVFLFMKRNVLTTFFLMSAFLGSSALLAVFTGGMWTPFAERYMYIPCATFVIGVTFLLWKIVATKKLVQKFLILLFPVFMVTTAYATVSRCLTWQDNEALFRDTVAKSPSFVAAKNELANALREKGKTAEALEIIRNLDGTGMQAASLNKALFRFSDGDVDGARKMLLSHVEASDSLESRSLEVLVKLTMEMVASSPSVIEKTRLRREVISWLGRLHELSGNPFYYYRLGNMYLQLNESATAQQFFAKAAEEFPDNSIYKKPSQKLAERLKSP
ncbi:tetratricopeptide repeat protein [Geopsychrobacter electrodiphilus]|uniref:tetratricopeptide repeat protein n=1 Tax=Geopsychrobacter electrodiphilus TaxID=225196 RepID=UPI00035CFDE6|nr:tetratricopeptide repeat protein [Geopsychrobacter electrodiphilus]